MRSWGCMNRSGDDCPCGALVRSCVSASVSVWQDGDGACIVGSLGCPIPGVTAICTTLSRYQPPVLHHTTRDDSPARLSPLLPSPVSVCPASPPGPQCAPGVVTKAPPHAGHLCSGESRPLLLASRTHARLPVTLHILLLPSPFKHSVQPSQPSVPPPPPHSPHGCHTSYVYGPKKIHNLNKIETKETHLKNEKRIIHLPSFSGMTARQ